MSLVIALTVLGVGTAHLSDAATKSGPGTMTILSKQVPAGSTGSSFTLRYTAPSNKSISGAVSVLVPSSGSPGTGFSPAPSGARIAINRLTCTTAVLSATPYTSVNNGAYPGDSPGTQVNMTVNCPANRYFSLTYSGVTAPRIAQGYTFLTSVLGGLIDTQPVERITPLGTAALTVTAPRTVAAGAPFSFTVAAKDSFGNVTPAYRGTVALNSDDPLVSGLPSSYLFTATDNGTHTFTGVSLVGAGTRSLTATDRAIPTMTASSLTTVTAGALHHLALSPALSAVSAGQSQTYTATGVDAYGNSLGELTAATVFSIGDGSCIGATCTATSVGDHAVTGTDATKTGTATQAVTGGTLDHLVLSPATASTAAGGSQAFNAAGRDVYDNSLGDVTSAAVFTIEDGSCTDALCGATSAGDHTVTGTVAGRTGIAIVTVTAGPLDHLVLSPVVSTVAAGESQTYKAAGYDVFDNSLGDVTSSTVFSIANAVCPEATCGGDPGSYLVTGTSGGRTGTAGLTVLGPPVWTDTGSLTNGRSYATATLLSDGKVLAVSGTGNGSTGSSAELYDPATGAWTPTGSMSRDRWFGLSATLLPDGKVLVVGGYTGTYTTTAELYDPATGAWTDTGSLTRGRWFGTATLLPNGKVLVAGGIGDSGYALTAELYDPATGVWTDTGSLSAAHWFGTATLLADGKVLIAGGRGEGSQPLGTAELYDPATGVFTETGSMSTARWGPTATLLPNGTVLVAGGNNNGSGTLASAELYDPATGVWTTTGSMSAARDVHTATLLPTGKVLVAGGQGISAPQSGAELFDPSTGAWSSTATLAHARAASTATLLGDGRVLVAGGYGGVGDDYHQGSAELYGPS